MAWMMLILMLGAQDPEPAAPVTVAAPAAEAPAAVSDDDRIICRKDEQTGSLVRTKTCLTKAEWRKRRARDRGEAERVLELETQPGVQSQ